jgi:hypothetical protein
MDEEPVEPNDPDEPIDLGPHERADISSDMRDLDSMRAIFSPQGVKGVVIECEDCGANHYYEWELLRDNLDHLLQTGEPRMHEPAFQVHEDEYVEWDYAKGYVDAMADSGLEPGRLIEVSQCPWCETPAETFFQFCPRCGRSLGAVRLYRELLGRGIPEGEARALLVRAGYEPF